MKVKTVKLTICECGHLTLKDGIPLGSEYEVDPSRIIPVVLMCGGCNKVMRAMAIWCRRYENSHAGFLPLEIFDFAVEAQAFAA